MEKKKISVSLSSVILLVVVVCGIIFGLGAYIIYDKVIKNDDIPTLSTNDNYQQNESLLEEDDDELYSENETNNNSQVSNTLETTSNTTGSENTSNVPDVSNTTNTSTTPSTSTPTSVTGKPSSKQSPLSVGEWSIASKYVSGEYVDVPVKVTKVTRGSAAAKEVKDYCESGSSIYRYEDAKAGMEWAVVEYQVDLSKMEKDSSVRMDTDITGTGNNSSVKYNGYTYILSTMNMTSGYTKGKVVTCKFATTLPIGCTDYLIEIGSYSHTKAYFIGK